LFSISTSATNDAYGVSIADAFKTGFDFDTQAKKSFSTNNNAVLIQMLWDHPSCLTLLNIP
jgi:hypothetical protein